MPVSSLCPLLLLSMLQESKQRAARERLEVEALSITVDTFRLAANAVGASDLQNLRPARKLLG